MTLRSWRTFSYLFVLSLMLGVPAYGQSTRGTFSGTVTDTTGAVVPGATVTITNAATGITAFTGTTNQDGGYVGFEKVEV